jgi:hypothetical protein
MGTNPAEAIAFLERFKRDPTLASIEGSLLLARIASEVEQPGEMLNVDDLLVRWRAHQGANLCGPHSEMGGG